MSVSSGLFKNEAQNISLCQTNKLVVNYEGAPSVSVTVRMFIAVKNKILIILIFIIRQDIYQLPLTQVVFVDSLIIIQSRLNEK